MKNNRKAMSVIEVVMSIAILLAFSIPIIGLATLTKASGKRNVYKTQALLIAQNYIEDMKFTVEKFNRPIQRSSIRVPRMFTVKYGFSPSSLGDGLVKYSVSVSYKQFKQNKTVTLSTLISQKGSIYEYK